MDFQLPDVDPYMTACARVAAIARKSYDRTGDPRCLDVARYAEGRYLKRGLEIQDAEQR